MSSPASDPASPAPPVCHVPEPPAVRASWSWKKSLKWVEAHFNLITVVTLAVGCMLTSILLPYFAGDGWKEKYEKLLAQHDLLQVKANEERLRWEGQVNLCLKIKAEPCSQGLATGKNLSLEARNDGRR
jgi:hypothetical protein